MLPSLGRNASWMFLGQSGYALGQWVMLVVLARLGGPALVGQWTLGLAITAPIFFLCQLQMREVQVVDASGRHAFVDYRAVRLGTTVVALLATAAVALLAGYSATVVAVIVAVGLARAVEGLSDVYYGLVQRHERLDRVAQSMLLRTVLGCAAFVLVLTVTGSLVAGLLAQAASWAAIWGSFDRRVARSWQQSAPQHGGNGKETMRRRLRLAWTGLPLGAALLLLILNANVPRYMVEAFLGFEALGIFAALAHFIVAGNTVVLAVCQAASPRLANLFAQGNVGPFRRIVVQLCGIGALLGLCGVLVAFWLGEPILRLVYGEAFSGGGGGPSSHAQLLVWIMLVGTIGYGVAPLGYSLSAMHRFKVQPVILGFAVGVNVLAGLILVPRFGLTGAVGGWGLAVVCQALIGLILTARYLRRAAQEANGGRTLSAAGEGGPEPTFASVDGSGGARAAFEVSGRAPKG